MHSHKSELPLRIILDIPSLKNEFSGRILHYNDNELFEFLAIGGSSRFTEIKIDFENQSLWFEKEFLRQTRKEQHAFLPTEEMINSLATSQDAIAKVV